MPPATDFNDFLHELRSRELERLPAGAGTVLHGGASGSWYFEWFDERYPTEVDKHIAVEAFSPGPDPLPPNVEWHRRTLGDLSPIEDSSVDLVFAGEVLEHLWPEDVVGFLAEAHRALRPGGTIAVDSPNRRVTTKLEWDHPEHTVEFTVDEARRLFELAGFDQIKIRGIWLSFDAEKGRLLPFDDLGKVGGWDSRRRAVEAEARPEDSFVWWAEATRGPREPELAELNSLVQASYETYRARRFGRMHHTLGSKKRLGDRTTVRAPRWRAGKLLLGPYVPMRPGRWVARFRVAAEPPRWRRPESDEPLGSIDVAIGDEPTPTIVAERTLTAQNLPLDGEARELEVPFELESTGFGAQFRVHTLGRVRMRAEFPVEVEPAAGSGAGEARIPVAVGEGSLP